MRMAAAGAILLSVGMPLSAHRLDEYLQATTLSVEKDRFDPDIRVARNEATLLIRLSIAFPLTRS